MEPNQLNRLQMVQFECPSIRDPRVSFTLEEVPFPIFCPVPSFIPLSAVYIIGLLWKARLKGGNFLERNQFNRLQMVQFECHRVINPCVSFTFEEFPFPIFCPAPSFPSSICSIKKWLLWGLGKKVEIFWNKISLTGCKWSSLNAPGS